ncbi:MAG: hypothetical protein IT385_03860 [Deltaproteobacteria bacterium]|nr:hypothetical protein [Deltaproteobacteria bacterium]
MKPTPPIVITLGLLGSLAFGQLTRAEGPVNPDFADGLTGWTVDVSGGDVAPGGVTLVGGPGGQAELAEGDAFLVSLSQAFVLPLDATSLVFDLTAVPGFDRGARFIPDAFEAWLVYLDGRPAVVTWSAHSDAFFNLQEDGTAHAGPGVVYDGTRVALDVSGVAPGAEVMLAWHVVGGDEDTGSAVRVGPLVVRLQNQAPLAAAGADVSAECAATVTLDGMGSSDPEGAALTYTWRDAGGVIVGTSATVEVRVGVGAVSYTLTVMDDAGVSASDTIVVTGADTTAPVITSTAPSVQVVANATCDGVVPGVLAGLVASDACAQAGPLVKAQAPAGGSALEALGAVALTITVEDPAGNVASQVGSVTLVDTTAPSVSGLPTTMTVPADADCEGVVPALAPTLADNCTRADLVTLVQAPAAGAALVLGAATEVTVTARDGASNATIRTVTVTLTDTPDDACNVVVEAPPETAPEQVEVVAEESPEPVVEEAPEPAVEESPEAEAEPEPEPVIEETPEPVIEETPEPETEEAPEPVTDAPPEPVSEPAAEVVEPAPTGAPDTGTSSSSDAGCGCEAGSSGAPRGDLLALVTGLALFAWGRRRRTATTPPSPAPRAGG